MFDKPKHLSAEYAAQFNDKSIVDAYGFRPEYPAETFEILSDLMGEGDRVVLDIGCGTGYIARYLVDCAERIDAVDISQNMINEAKNLPRGNDPKIHWICSSMEDAELSPPYSLVTAGASLHWMDWYVVLPKLKQVLAPGGFLAIVENRTTPPAWQEQLAIIQKYSTNRDFQHYNLVDELEKRNLYHKMGQRLTSPISLTQSIDEYIESIHARNGFSRERMTAESAKAFDQEIRDLLSSHSDERYVNLEIAGEITWGIPA